MGCLCHPSKIFRKFLIVPEIIETEFRDASGDAKRPPDVPRTRTIRSALRSVPLSSTLPIVPTIGAHAVSDCYLLWKFHP